MVWMAGEEVALGGNSPWTWCPHGGAGLSPTAHPQAELEKAGRPAGAP